MKSIVTDEDMNIKEVFVQVGDPDKEHKEQAWNLFPAFSWKSFPKTMYLKKILVLKPYKAMDPPRRFSV